MRTFRPGRSGFWPSNRSLAAGALLYGATLLAYLPALRGGFVWDDDAHVTSPKLQSLHGLWRIWFQIGATQQYYPVLHSAFWLERHLWGAAPLGYHLLNVLLHATSACLFVALLQQLWGGAGSLVPPVERGAPGGRALPNSAAWLAGLIFALHPVCVESVAWISEEKNTLSTVFYLLAAWTYLRFDEIRNRPRPEVEGHPRKSVATYVLASLFFVLALLSKSVTATLPAGLLVVIWWRRGQLDWRRDAVPLLPWFGIGAAAGLFTAWVERAVVMAGMTAVINLDFLQRCLLAGRAIWFYLGKLFWPADLVFNYPRWRISAGAAWQYFFPLALLGLLAALGWRARPRFRRDREAPEPSTGRARRAPLAGLLFFVGSLFPALGFFDVYPFVFSYVADHFQYLACLGIIALFAGGFASRTSLLFGGARVLGAGAALILGTLGALTWRQCQSYRSEGALYRSILARNPASWMAHNNLGVFLFHAGRPREAILHYEEALRLEPADFEADNNLGVALASSGRWTEAIGYYDRALRLLPIFAEAQCNLGIALLNTGRWPEAIVHLGEAVRLKPDFSEAQNSLGVALGKAGRTSEAIAHFQAAVRLNPRFADAHNNLGVALRDEGKIDQAKAEFDAADRLAAH